MKYFTFKIKGYERNMVSHLVSTPENASYRAVMLALSLKYTKSLTQNKHAGNNIRLLISTKTGL